MEGQLRKAKKQLKTAQKKIKEAQKAKVNSVFKPGESETEEEIVGPSAKRAKKKKVTKKVKKAKMLKKNESDSETSSSEESESESEDSDDVCEKKSTTTKMSYAGFLGCDKFIKKLKRAPRASWSALNSFVDDIEDIPENICQEGGKSFKKFNRELLDQLRVLENLVAYNVEKGEVKNSIKKALTIFEDLQDRIKPSKKKACLRKVLSWLKKPSTQKVIGTERCNDIRESLETEKKDLRGMFKMNSFALENYAANTDFRGRKRFGGSRGGSRGGYGGNGGFGGYGGNSGYNGYAGNGGYGGNGGYRGNGRGRGQGRGRGNSRGGRGQGSFQGGTAFGNYAENSLQNKQN